MHQFGMGLGNYRWTRIHTFSVNWLKTSADKVVQPNWNKNNEMNISLVSTTIFLGQTERSLVIWVSFKIKSSGLYWIISVNCYMYVWMFVIALHTISSMEYLIVITALKWTFCTHQLYLVTLAISVDHYVWMLIIAYFFHGVFNCYYRSWTFWTHQLYQGRIYFILFYI